MRVSAWIVLERDQRHGTLRMTKIRKRRPRGELAFKLNVEIPDHIQPTVNVRLDELAMLSAEIEELEE